MTLPVTYDPLTLEGSSRSEAISAPPDDHPSVRSLDEIRPKRMKT